MGDVLVTTANIMKPIAPMNGSHYTLVELQSYVGGYIETIYLNDKVLVVDEEGKLKGKLPNRIATGWLLKDDTYNCDWIAGDALLIDKKHIK